MYIQFPLKTTIIFNKTSNLHRHTKPMHNNAITADMGAAYGTAKAGVGIMKAGVLCPELIWKNLIPIIM